MRKYPPDCDWSTILVHDPELQEMLQLCPLSPEITITMSVTLCREDDTVVVLGFYVPPTAKVIWGQGLGLKPHPKDRRSPGLNS